MPASPAAVCRLASIADEEELSNEEILLARMDAGLYTLQQVR